MLWGHLRLYTASYDVSLPKTLNTSPKSEVQTPTAAGGFCLLVLLVGCCPTLLPADDFASRCADRAAIERVYHQHRLGTKPTFAETLPPATLERLVRLDLKKQTALQRTYGVAITPAQLAAEVQRINTSTRAPEMLAEIKAALGDDAEKFANAFAKPILVERLLRDKFENDAMLHLPQRREAEHARERLLASRRNGGSIEQ